MCNVNTGTLALMLWWWSLWIKTYHITCTHVNNNFAAPVRYHRTLIWFMKWVPLCCCVSIPLHLCYAYSGWYTKCNVKTDGCWSNGAGLYEIKAYRIYTHVNDRILPHQLGTAKHPSGLWCEHLGVLIQDIICHVVLPFKCQQQRKLTLKAPFKYSPCHGILLVHHYCFCVD